MEELLFRFTVAKILRVLKLNIDIKKEPCGFTVAKILRVLKQGDGKPLPCQCFTVAKILRVLKPQIDRQGFST